MTRRSSGGEPDRDTIDAEEDLMNRYESMVQTQIETLSDIDDKAARTLRVITLLLGVLFTGVSISVQYFHESGEQILLVQLVLVGAGFVFLLVSLGYASITYLSSVFKYGPTEKLGAVMAEYEVGAQDYRNHMLGAYSDIISQNRMVVRNNSRRFRRTMVLLLVGLVFLFLGGTSITLHLNRGVNGLLLIIGSLLALALTHYIEGEEYLTLEWQTDNDE